MKSAIADIVKRHWPLFVPYGILRRVVKGKQLARQSTFEPGFVNYEKNLASWQWLRELVLDADEKRMSTWATENYGCVIPFGPFQGMKYEACRRQLSSAARLGFYELELHPIIEEIVDRRYHRILNVGCSFGYYAIGLAMRMTDCEVRAYDLQPRERALCQALAQENSVADRVIVSERFDPPMFAELADDRTLVLCDIEGGELQLLDPIRSEKLAMCDILVEMHDVYDRQISSELPRRFRDTHDIRIIREGDHGPLRLPEKMHSMGALERLVAVHGAARWGATPWAFMTSTARKNGIHN